MLKYNEYIIDREFKKLIFIIESKNESISSIIDKIKSWLSTFIRKYGLEAIFKRITKLNIVYSLLTLSLLISAFNISKDDVIEKVRDSNIPNKESIISDLELIVVSNDTIKIDKETRQYIDTIGFRESSGDWTKINQLGYIGKYQFGGLALEDVGLDKTKLNSKNFKKNPLIWSEKEQDHAMIKLLRNNVKYLGNYLTEYTGKTINGIELTKSGLLAASHLVGAKKVKKYLKSNGKYIPKDGNNTSVEEYLKMFSGFKINI